MTEVEACFEVIARVLVRRLAVPKLLDFIQELEKRENKLMKPLVDAIVIEYAKQRGPDAKPLLAETK